MFDLRCKKNGNPLVIGHRGALALAPGNTFPALEAGVANGADMLEIDVQLSADGEVMLFHDFDLQHTAGISGHIGEHSAEMLRTLDVGSSFDPKFKGTTIPALSEVLSWAKGHVPLMIEVKHEPVRDDALEEKTVRLVEDYDMVDEVVIISFDQFALARVKQLNPGIATSFVYIGRYRNPLCLVDGLELDALSPATNFLTPEEVNMIHRAGYACSPGGLWWDYPLLKAWNVDTVSSNDPSIVQFH